MPSTRRAAAAAAANSHPAPPAVHNNVAQPLHANTPPVFEMVVLGCGGGPLETDCSGYLLKPFSSSWEDGMLAIEGGSGIGALVSLFRQYAPEHMFPDVDFPPSYSTPVLKAAYIFSYLTCYLITHAHLDHAMSLIMLSGSVPPRHFPEGTEDETVPPVPSRIPVYGTKATLDNLAEAYGGGLWPELGQWASESEIGWTGRRKRRRLEDEGSGAGAKFSPLTPLKPHKHLHASLPISTMVFPVAHGRTSQGPYASSAAFIRYDPTLLVSRPASRRPSQAQVLMQSDDGQEAMELTDESAGRELLFFGDFESSWRSSGEENVDAEGREASQQLNEVIWKQAAESWDQGRLAGIFLECSYETARPAAIMYGHLSPPGIFHELQALAALVKRTPGVPPLQGLRVYITHIKEFLIPHASGMTARELIKRQLDELEQDLRLGVSFVIVSPGDRLLI